MIYVIGILILFLLIAFIFIFFKCIKLKEIKSSIDTCSMRINEFLEEKLDMVKEMFKSVRNEKLKSSFNYDESYDIYEKENVLYNIGYDLNKYIKEGRSKKLKEMIKVFNEKEEELEGLKDFYNASVQNYNSIYTNKYLNKIFKLLRFESYKPFRIRKIEDYEIFKN